MTTTKPAPAPSLADDLHQAGALLAPLCGKSGRSIPLVLCLLGAIWLAVERLRQAVQTSASADKWQSSRAATIAKGGELGIRPWPGESMSDYRTRIAAELKARGSA